MTRLVLRYLDRDLELPDGQFLVGRSASCQISLDDPLVSRSHARLVVRGGEVTFEDLGSRNGVRVNGEAVRGTVRLSVGDRLGVGSQELHLVATGVQEPVSRGAPTHRFDRFEVIGGLAEKALALGRGDEAERILATSLADVLAEARAGRQSPSTAHAARYATRLADATGKGNHVDYVIELYTVLGEVLPAEVVDLLYSVLRKVGPIDLVRLRGYLAALRSGAAALSPSERFLLSRVEGLERVAAAR